MRVLCLEFLRVALLVCLSAGIAPASAGLVVTNSLTAPAAIQGNGRAEIEQKKRILLNSIVKLRQDYDLKADYFAWVTRYGPVKTWKSPTLQEELYRRWQQSQSSLYLPKEKAMHLAEPGSEERDSQLDTAHTSIIQGVIWQTIGPALVALGELVTIIPAAGDPVGLGVELVKLIGHAVGDNDDVTPGNAKQLLEKYQPKVGKLSPAQVRQLLSELYWKQAAEIVAELRQLNAASQSAIGVSVSPPLGVMEFDASEAKLTFSDDFITSVGGSLADGLVGANIKLPQFQYMGPTTWGYPHHAFAALDYASEIVRAGEPGVDLLTEFPALLYFPELNRFAAVMPYLVNIFNTHGLAEELARGLESSAALFPFLAITPNTDFWRATEGFSQSSSAGFENQLFLIGFQVPEPGAMFLMSVALVALLQSSSIRSRNGRTVPFRDSWHKP